LSNARAGFNLKVFLEDGAEVVACVVHGFVPHAAWLGVLEWDESRFRCNYKQVSLPLCWYVEEPNYLV
jgi:hypothetical protein